MPGSRFWAAAADECRSVLLEGLLALYHRPSGQTHLLAQPLPEILAALEENQITSDELLLRLGVDPDEASRAAIGDHLRQLEQIGLVQRA